MNYDDWDAPSPSNAQSSGAAVESGYVGVALFPGVVPTVEAVV